MIFLLYTLKNPNRNRSIFGHWLRTSVPPLHTGLRSWSLAQWTLHVAALQFKTMLRDGCCEYVGYNSGTAPGMTGMCSGCKPIAVIECWILHRWNPNHLPTPEYTNCVVSTLCAWGWYPACLPAGNQHPASVWTSRELDIENITKLPD